MKYVINELALPVIYLGLRLLSCSIGVGTKFVLGANLTSFACKQGNWQIKPYFCYC